MLHPCASGIAIIITTNINSDVADDYYNDDEKVKLSITGLHRPLGL
jgi:hypothetical protein